MLPVSYPMVHPPENERMRKLGNSPEDGFIQKMKFHLATEWKQENWRFDAILKFFSKLFTFWIKIEKY